MHFTNIDNLLPYLDLGGSLPRELVTMNDLLIAKNTIDDCLKMT